MRIDFDNFMIFSMVFVMIVILAPLTLSADGARLPQVSPFMQPLDDESPFVDVRNGCYDGDVDGLCDFWEIDGYGISIYYDGAFYDFRCGLGGPYDCPRLDKKDIFLEIDYFNTHQPSEEAIEAVKASIAGKVSPPGDYVLHISPINELITNPDDGGNPHDQLYVKFDTPITETYSDMRVWQNSFGDPGERTLCAAGPGCPEENKTLTAKMNAFRYGLFAHKIKIGFDPILYEGVADLPGNQLVVKEYLNDAEQQRIWLEHELCHTLNVSESAMGTCISSAGFTFDVNPEPSTNPPWGGHRDFEDIVITNVTRQILELISSFDLEEEIATDEQIDRFVEMLNDSRAAARFLSDLSSARDKAEAKPILMAVILEPESERTPISIDVFDIVEIIHPLENSIDDLVDKGPQVESKSAKYYRPFTLTPYDGTFTHQPKQQMRNGIAAHDVICKTDNTNTNGGSHILALFNRNLEFPSDERIFGYCIQPDNFSAFADRWSRFLIVNNGLCVIDRNLEIMHKPGLTDEVLSLRLSTYPHDRLDCESYLATLPPVEIP